MNYQFRPSMIYARFISIATAVVGIITILSAGTPALQTRLVLLDDVISIFVQQGAALVTVLIGFILLVLARSLWQRKRSAWLLTIILLALSSTLHLLKGLDYEETILSLVLIVGLLVTRRQFHTRSDPPSIRHAITFIFLSLVVSIGYAALGFTLLTNHFIPNKNLVENITNGIRLFIAPMSITIQPSTDFSLFFIESVYVIFFVGIVSAIILLSRAVVLRNTSSSDEHTQARQIIEKYGKSSVAYFALLADKSYFFSSGGSVVAYVVESNIALALGDPIGPSENIGDAIREFRAHCTEQGWKMAFYQVLPDYLEHYQQQKFKHIAIGQEAIVDLKNFTLSGNARKSMRQHFNRTQKRGYTVQIHHPPFTTDMIDILREISDDWLATVQGTEKRFSLGWFYEDYVQDNPIMAVHDQQDAICAFANIVPEYTLNEATIDMMRYHSEVDAGVMDFLFVSLFLWAKEQGYDSFNLGLVALAGVGGEPDDPRLEKGLHYIFEHLNQFYNFKGLYQFKSKFHPQWQERYLIFSDIFMLPSLAIALVRADSGDDFIWTYLREWRLDQQAKRLERHTVKRSSGEGVAQPVEE